MIKVNLDKAKSIAHGLRRTARQDEFQPWDIAVTIPVEATNAEIEREKIRDKYAILQTSIDKCSDVDQLAVIYNTILLHK